jgi:hypothetical protein
MLKPQKSPEQNPKAPNFQRQIRLGDLYEMSGRERTTWTVEKLINARNLPPQAEMSQVDGLGRVTVRLDDLITEVLFKRISEAFI